MGSDSKGLSVSGLSKFDLADCVALASVWQSHLCKEHLMGDLCLDGEKIDNPLSSNQIGHVVNDYSRVEENIYQGRHVVHVDAVTNTGFIIDSFGLHSSLGDIFSHLWTLTAYISRQFVDFIEDLVFHDIEEYSNNLATGSLRAFQDIQTTASVNLILKGIHPLLTQALDSVEENPKTKGKSCL